jgi:imidazole glycerol-phosphate synthase subunit HisF
VQQFTGDASKTRDTARLTRSIGSREVQQRGAGEIVLNCMASDGVRSGYDLAQLGAVRAICAVPLVASGGAGNAAHFSDAFRIAGVDAALGRQRVSLGRNQDSRSQATPAREGIEVRI